MKTNNATLEWLRKKHPALVGVLKTGGMTMPEVFKLVVEVEQIRWANRRGLASDFEV